MTAQLLARAHLEAKWSFYCPTCDEASDSTPIKAEADNALREHNASRDHRDAVKARRRA